MTPKMESHLRHLKGALLFVVALSCFLYVFWILDSRTPNEPVVTIAPEPTPPADEWLYVNTNNVLFFPVKEDKCLPKPKYALLQVHESVKMLVIARHGKWVEVEMEDQSRLFTHGCIHESMLEKRDD